MPITACTSHPTATQLPSPPPPPTGAWLVDNARCEIIARLPELTLRTDGRLDAAQSLRLQIQVGPPLQRPPVLELTNLPVAIPVSGPSPVRPRPNESYAAQLPYTPTTAASMLSENTFLLVWYQPAGQPQPRSHHLPTTNFLTALRHLSQSCPD